MKKDFRKGYAAALIAPTLLLMVVVFAIPMLMFFNYSFYSYSSGKMVTEYTLGTYIKFLTDPYYMGVAGSSLKLSLTVTAISLLLGYPLSYALCKIKNAKIVQWMSIIIFSPLVVSVVVRSYGWQILLSDQGIINFFLLKLGIISEPLKLVYNEIGVMISLVHIYLPFVVFPIYTVLKKMDASIKEASNDLGAGWFYTFRRITLPLSMPGIISGVQLCFTMTMGAFVTPSLLGGGRVNVLPITIYNTILDMNWPFGTVAGVVLLALAMVAVAFFNAALDRCKLD